MNFDEKTKEIEIPVLKKTGNRVVRVDFAAIGARSAPAGARSVPAGVTPLNRRKPSILQRIQDMDLENPAMTRLGIVLVILLLSLLIL